MRPFDEILDGLRHGDPFPESGVHCHGLWGALRSAQLKVGLPTGTQLRANEDFEPICVGSITHLDRLRPDLNLNKAIGWQKGEEALTSMCRLAVELGQWFPLCVGTIHASRDTMDLLAKLGWVHKVGECYLATVGLADAALMLATEPPKPPKKKPATLPLLRLHA